MNTDTDNPNAAPALHWVTPLVPSDALTRLSGREVWLKLDCLQPPGSFKLRGIGLACQRHARGGAQRLLSSSGGNAGLAVAYAGQRLGLPVTVVVPQTSSARARALLAEYGAQVIVHGAAWHEAHAHALSLQGPTDAMLHPFDHPWLWEGHASLIDEAVRQGPKPDAVVLSVGGGGLFAGVVQGLRRNGWNDVPVLAVETEGAASLHAALQAGKLVSLPTLSSIASSLASAQVCQQAFDLASSHPTSSVLVSDAQAVQACLQLMDAHRLLVEPACGAALAAAAQHDLPALRDCRRVLVVVCGGATATADMLAQWSRTL